MKFGEFKNILLDNYKSVFPESLCVIELGALGGDTFFVNYYLAGDKSEFPNGYEQNDIFHIQFHILQPRSRFENAERLTDDTELSENLTLTVDNKTIFTKPENSYMAYGSVTLPFRKTVGNADKILTALLKYAEITKKTLTELYEEEALPVNQQPNIVEFVVDKLGINETKKTEDIGYDYWGSKEMEPFEGKAYIEYYGGPRSFRMVSKIKKW